MHSTGNNRVRLIAKLINDERFLSLDSRSPDYNKGIVKTKIKTTAYGLK